MKTKFKKVHKFVGRSQHHTLFTTGRTKREAENKLRKAFGRAGYPTVERRDPDGSEYGGLAYVDHLIVSQVMS
jgi:hypothetical protein